MWGFWMQNSNFWSGVTSLSGSQTKPVVLCMQNTVISTRNTRLYGFQPSSEVFACKTATLGPDLQVCICPSPNVWYWALITAFLEQEYQVYVGSSHHLLFCACKTATLGQVSVGPKPNLWFSTCKTACLTSELLVSMGPSPHLRFLHAKQRLLYPNNKSLWVPDVTCRFVHARQRD